MMDIAHRSRLAKAACLVTYCLLLTFPAHAGQTATPDASPSPPTAPVAAPELQFTFDGPPPPVAPAVITRDASGRATIRAVRVTAPMRIDGVLDEALYSSVPPISDFIQVEPQEGAPATEKTEVWLAFDATTSTCRSAAGKASRTRVVANEMRRDVHRCWQGNDIVAFMLRHVLRPAQRRSIHHQCDRRPERRAGDQRAAV